MKTIQETYAERLEMLVQRYGQTKLAEVINSHAVLIQDWINSFKTDNEHRTSWTQATKAVRQIEMLLGLERGWFDQPVKDGEFINFPILSELSEEPLYQIRQEHATEELIQFRLLDVEKHLLNKISDINQDSIKCVDINRDWAVMHLGLKLDEIALVTVFGDNMYPTLNESDVLFVDTSIKEFINDGVYLLSGSSNIRIRRLQMVFDEIHIINDNNKYSNQKIAVKDKADLQVLAKVKRVWSLRRF